MIIIKIFLLHKILLIQINNYSLNIFILIIKYILIIINIINYNLLQMNIFLFIEYNNVINKILFYILYNYYNIHLFL